MKKIIFAGLVILLAVFFVTCDGLFPEEAAAEVEYTDVVYSPDGTQVRVYLDGVGVPKAKAQRAMSLDLSKMAYDFIEVIFSTTTTAPTTYARAQWELGQSAGISGVRRGIAYAATGANIALMAVGSKGDKTLLGVGEIGDVDGVGGAPFTIANNTGYVTFYLKSVKTGLTCGDELPASVAFDSLAFTDDPTIKTKATRSPLGDSDYPMYALPNATGAPATQKATYTFGGAAAPATDGGYLPQLIFARTTNPVADVQKRIPRYQSNGRYLIPKGNVNTKATVALDGYTLAGNEATKNVVPIVFGRIGTGIFSFYIDIPVILSTKATGTNGGDLKPVTWHLRTGFGSELYSLDDGVSSGGCVLMGIGVGSLDWLDIQWEWEPTTPPPPPGP